MFVAFDNKNLLPGCGRTKGGGGEMQFREALDVLYYRFASTSRQTATLYGSQIGFKN
jgi:hypothetical protein